MKANCSMELAEVRREHLVEIKDLHKSCGAQVQQSLLQCSHASNVSRISESIAEFSNLLKQKTSNLKECNDFRLKLNQDLVNLKKEASRNITRLKEFHQRQAVGVRSESVEANNILRRQIMLNHQLVANLTKTEKTINTCEKERDYYKNELKLSDAQFKNHMANYTSLAKGNELYRLTLQSYIQSNKNCQNSLFLCRNNTQSNNENMVELRNLHKTQIERCTQCLLQKSKFAANITSCQADVITKNSLIRNQTLELRDLKIYNNSLSIEKKNHAKMHNNAQNEIAYLKQENARLILETRSLFSKMNDMERILNSSSVQTSTLTNHISGLESTIAAQEGTIRHLLDEQEARMADIEQDRLMCNKTIPLLSNVQKVYWRQKTELTSCLNGRHFESHKRDLMGKLNHTYITHYRNVLQNQANVLIKCMQNNTNPKFRNNHLQYTAADLQKLLKLTENAIPLNPKIFNSRNHLKTCVYALDSCREEIQRRDKLLTNYLHRDQLMLDLDVFDSDPSTWKNPTQKPPISAKPTTFLPSSTSSTTSTTSAPPTTTVPSFITYKL